jgi:hypothetical protein
MPTISVADADAHDCPFAAFTPCRGARCMAWTWLGPAFDMAETDNLIDGENGQYPTGVPASPEGEGWETDGPTFKKGYHRSGKDKLPQATGQRWRRARKVQIGFCGRVGADQRYDHF